MKKMLSLLMLLVTIVSGAWAGTENFSMASKWGDQPFTKTQNGITVTFSENDKTGTQNGYIKFVKGQTMTISSTVGNITALAFTSDGNYYGKADGTTVNTGTITGAGTANISWAGDASEIIISNDSDKGGDWRVASIIVTYSSAPATEPTITAQPANAAYVIGTSDYPVMSVEATASAGSLKYQWKYSNDGENFTPISATVVPSAAEATLLGSEAISAFQPTEPTTIYLICSVTDDNGTVDSDVATLNIVNGTAPTISVAANKTVALKGGKITLTATVTGTPDPTIQWYSKSGELIQAIEGATSAEYAATFTEYGTFEFIAKATNGAGVADSDPIAITVKPALQSVKFSNGVYGAIAEPATADVNGNIEVPYINYGETPEIDKTSCTAFNDTEAEISTEENVVTVTSGAYSATYNYEFIPVNPIAVTADIASTDFTNVPDWVFNKYGYDATKGMKFAKAVDEADNLRIAKGNTRQYYFVGPAKSLTLTQVGTKRNVNVYVNGESVKTNVSNDAIGAIALSGTKDNIVIIEAAADTKGDGGFSAYTIAACDVKPDITTQPVNVEYEIGSTTYPTMSVEATATSGDMKYQWEFSTTGDAETFQAIPTTSVPSAATATLSGEEVIKALNNTNDGVQPGIYYARCRITDAAGTAYSAAATLTIKAANTPNITTQPQDVTYVIGSETCDNMTIEATPATEGDALAYEWQYSLNGETFEAIPALFVPSATTSTLIGTEAIALINNLDPKPDKVYIKCVVSETGANDAISNVATVTLQAPASYSESVNIEQLVLDNGVNYDIANEFVKKYIEYASLNALDSLNDADGKFQRNEPFLGLKLKTAGAYIKVTLKQGSSLKVKLGNIGDNVKVNINGTEQEDIVKMTTKDASYMTTIYEYTAADADAVVTFTTSSTGTVVFKQIMIDEEIAQVILPYAVDMPTAPANGTVEMPASANPGDEVTIVVTPDEGYELDAITVTGKSTNNAYEVSTDNKFTMPDENVNVTVTFKQITGINNVNANDNANSDANVKVIKNGKLYIGNYNIAGQQVK